MAFNRAANTVREARSGLAPRGVGKTSLLVLAGAAAVALFGLIAWLAPLRETEVADSVGSAVARLADGQSGGRTDSQSVNVASGQTDSQTDSQSHSRYVGSGTCQGCHAKQHAAWRGSQHDRAMQHASPASVLGDFADARFTYAGVESRFYRRGDRYFVTTDGADGALAEFEISYTFGVEPLQQYLVVMPDGRLQALSIAWDSRPVAAGGQRWFHLYPDERVDHKDVLHWTGRAQNWNFMCADCHSTAVSKGYDPKTDTFKTRWAELNVGCEACHGPGSDHVTWAGSPGNDPSRGLTVRFDQRQLTSWVINPDTGSAERAGPAPEGTEVEVCAQCHARRAQIAEGYEPGKPFLDHYLPSLLETPLYHLDGQQHGEVFIWGSFLQSRMHAKGVTCSNCHDPHSQQLVAPGNGVCAQCHDAARFDRPEHHHHPAGQSGSACVDCHMPATTYMVVDPRRDHSFRIPRPDRTLTLGTPNACNSCHSDRDAAWAQAAIQTWSDRPKPGYQHFAEGFAAAARGEADAAADLSRLLGDTTLPDLVRASAASALVDVPAPGMPGALVAGLADPSPLVRLGSLQALDGFPIQQYAELVVPLLHDPVRAIRQEAVRNLAALPVQQLRASDQAAFAHARSQYLASLRLNADRPEARMALGTFLAAGGREEEALRALREAIDMAPDFAPAYINLADLLRRLGRETEGAAVLREGLAVLPAVADLHHALGLSLIRQGRQDEALVSLAEATTLGPDDLRIGYVYAVAQNSLGQPSAALQTLDRLLVLQPENREVLLAAALFARDAGRLARSRAYASTLSRLYPDDPGARDLLRELSRPPAR